MITKGNYDFVSVLGGGNQMSNKGLIAMGVLDGTGNPVDGATISTTPASGKYAYSSGGIPSSSASATDADGFAFIFNVPGQVTVSASKSGATFKSHPVMAHPDSFTLTVVTE